MGEVEACHSSLNHGLAVRAENEARLAQRLQESQECDATLAEAIENQLRECGEYNDLAENLISGGLPGCTPGNAGALVDVGRNWRTWVNANLGNLEGQQAECNAANDLVETYSALCAAKTEAYEEAFCRTREACIHHNSCFAHEVEIYEAMRAEIEAAAEVRQQQYITAMQAQCLVNLMMTALRSGTPIPADPLTACDDVDVSALMINFPDMPDEPEDCPATQPGDPPCEPVPHVLGWTSGIADGGEIDLTCGEGSPASCSCELLDIQGYSAGAVVRCEHGLRVEKSTDPNSCPAGMKIYSPQDRQDVDLLAPYLSGEEGRKIHSPDSIVDITKDTDGCGGCTSHAMNSNTPEQSMWHTSDGSPWWLADAPFSEPNGDYKANCYLQLRQVHHSHVHFNDAIRDRCYYSSDAYLCQPIRTPQPPSCQCEVKSYLHGIGSEFQTITQVGEWVTAAFASGHRGVSALEVATTGGTGHCAARVAQGAGGSNQLNHVYQEGSHNYPLPTGNDNIGSIIVECVSD